MDVKGDSRQSLNEMDLVDFIKGMWGQRWLIAIVAGLVMLIAIAYASLSSPVYEARAYILPPQQSDLEKFDFGGIKKTKLKHYSAEDVYSQFVKNLQSDSLKRELFEEKSLISKNKVSGEVPTFRQFSKSLVVQSVKGVPGRFAVVVSSDDPAESERLLRVYLDTVSDVTKKELINSFSEEVEVRSRRVEARMKFLRDEAAAKRLDTLLRLREAVKVASAAGFDKPLIVLDNLALQSPEVNDPRMIYLRGTRALTAEIKVLEARESDDPYIDGMRKLQGKYSLYKDLIIAPEDFAVYRIEGEILSADSPSKPNRALILALGTAMGLSLGVVCGFIRQFWIRSKRIRVERN